MAMLDTNALGALRVTQAFPPLLRRSKAARVVMMSSSLGSLSATAALGTDVWNVNFAGYCASKATLNMLTLKLAKDLMGEGIKVNAAGPGLATTDLTGRTPEEAAAIACGWRRWTAWGRQAASSTTAASTARPATTGEKAGPYARRSSMIGKRVKQTSLFGCRAYRLFRADEPQGRTPLARPSPYIDIARPRSASISGLTAARNDRAARA